MTLDHEAKLENARELTRISAQWLRIIDFAAFKGAPVFSPSVCHYHSMLDPAATDADRLAACRAMHKCVLRRADVEELEGQSRRLQYRLVDPYQMHWHTTAEGAALWMIAHLLSCAIRGFEAEAAIS
jgi:hypothetical protein